MNAGSLARGRLADAEVSVGGERTSRGLVTGALAVWTSSGRARRLASTVVASAGTVAWSAYGGRLLLRSLHMLQLEGYQTARFMGWSARRLDRWVSAERLLAHRNLNRPSGVARIHSPHQPVGRGKGNRAYDVVAQMLCNFAG